LQLPLLSAITMAMPLAISESCCFGVARIVFKQLKQRMLTLFYFVQTVGGALIKVG
jgi:ABC-type maltose transport system permease subunit